MQLLIKRSLSRCVLTQANDFLLALWLLQFLKCFIKYLKLRFIFVSSLDNLDKRYEVKVHFWSVAKVVFRLNTHPRIQILNSLECLYILFVNLVPLPKPFLKCNLPKFCIMQAILVTGAWLTYLIHKGYPSSIIYRSMAWGLGYENNKKCIYLHVISSLVCTSQFDISKPIFIEN